MPNQPLIGFGQVRHRRLSPVVNAFAYRTYFLYLPLRALNTEVAPDLNRNKFGLLSFYDKDHGEGGSNALAWVDALLASQGILDCEGEIWLQTFPRVMGFVFKPVSFWRCYRKDGTLGAVIAEVNNTFGERHIYVLRPERSGLELQTKKVFHVSPFFPVSGGYRFRLGCRLSATQAPDKVLSRVDLYDEGELKIETSWSGTLYPLTGQTTRRAFLGVPLMTLSVVALIHYQAIKLWLKKVRFHKKPSPPENMVS